MSKKSSKSPSGEGRDQPDHLRQENITEEDIKTNSSDFQPQGTRRGTQENLSNRGYDEDQPGEPIRSSGSLKKEDQQAPAGEPEKSELKENL